MNGVMITTAGVTTSPTAMTADTIYFLNCGTTPVRNYFTLPASPTVGQVVVVTSLLGYFQVQAQAGSSFYYMGNDVASNRVYTNPGDGSTAYFICIVGGPTPSWLIPMHSAGVASFIAAFSATG